MGIKPIQLTLNITTPSRKYRLNWNSNAGSILLPANQLIVTVTTNRDNKESTEYFEFSGIGKNWDAVTVQTIESWFYDTFAYDYANIYITEPSGVRAEILYDLGLFSIEEPVEEFGEGEPTSTDETKEYFVRTCRGNFSTMGFRSAKCAEQWAYENLYEGTEDTSGNSPFVVFSVKPPESKKD